MGIADASKSKKRVSYETMLILRPDMLEDEKNRQIARFEAFLFNEGVEDVICVNKGRKRLAYPISKYLDGVFVLFRFNTSGKVAQLLYDTLNNLDAESQGNILRWANFKTAKN